MQRYMKQVAAREGEEALGRFGGMGEMGAPILELNVEHPAVRALRDAHASNPEGTSTKERAELIYDLAALTGGYPIEEPAVFAKKVASLMGGPEGEGTKQNLAQASSKDPTAAPTPS